MASLKTWLKAARPRTVLLSFSGILMGGLLAAKSESCNYWAILFAALTAIALQILSNLANDYGDYKKGVDNDNRVGPQREMQSGEITEKEMKKGICLTSVACFMLGGILIFLIARLSWTELAAFAIFGVAAVLAALFYTLGKRPYGYRGLGDLYCFLFFGLAATAGCYYLATKNLDFSILLPAAAMGFMSNAVLNINNMRDFENDKRSGKNSLVVKIGLDKAFLYHIFLIVGGFAMLSIYLIINRCAFHSHLFWLVLPLFVKDIITIKRELHSHKLDPMLPKQVIHTFLLTIAFGTAILL